MVDNFVEWASSSTLHHWVVAEGSTWVVLETLHFFGMTLLLGSLLFIDLRMVGFFKEISLRASHKLLPWVFIGFGINLITGILFYFGDPQRYTINIGFQVKMVLVFLAGLNALWYYLKIDGPMKEWDENGDTPALAKMIGAASLVLWFGVLISGRLIPYVGTG